MGWDSTPPTQAELGGNANSWASAPPTQAELAGTTPSPGSSSTAQTPSDPDSFGAAVKKVAGDYWDDAKYYGKGALDGGLRALDYGGGLARTTVAQGLNAAGVGNSGAVNGDDWISALKGQAPSSAQYMDKLGVPEGGSFNMPGVGKVTTRGFGGFIGDVALDPLTYLTMGGEPAAKAGIKAAQAAEAASDSERAVAPLAKAAGAGELIDKAGDAATVKGLADDADTPSMSSILQQIGNVFGNKTADFGDGVYKSGYKTVDAKLAAKGQDPLSQVMLDNGRPAGTASQLSDAVEKLVQQKAAERAGLYDQINQAGKTVNLDNAMAPALQRGKELVQAAPNDAGQVKDMTGWMNNYEQPFGREIPVDKASDMKSRLYNAELPANSYSPNGRALGTSDDMTKQFARGFKEDIVRAGNEAGPGIGDQVGELNDEMAPMLAAQGKILPTEVTKSANKNLWTPVDSMAATGAAMASHNPMMALPMLAMKKASDAINTTSGRTYLGNMISGLGNTGFVDPMVRRAMIDQNQSPWASMQKDKK